MASRFKAECLALIDVVEATKEPITITKRGRAVARLVAIEEPESVDLLGSVTFHSDDICATGEPWRLG